MLFKKIKESIILFADLTKVSWQIIFGQWTISGISQPIVTIFGGAHLPKDDRYAVIAQQVASRLIALDISVITGGGSGIMRAASCILPLKEKKAKIIGIGVRSLKEEHNECVEKFLLLDYLFARKWLMIRSAKAFVAFPGGFGTLDELMEVITLMYTKELARAPIVLVGVAYWQDFVAWARTDALAGGLIDQQQIDLFIMTDDIDEIVGHISEHCSHYVETKKIG